MNFQLKRLVLAMVISMPCIQLANASELILPNVFSSGTPAIAADVNANFNATSLSVNNNDERITALEKENKALVALIGKLQGLAKYVSVDEENLTVTFSGVNLVVNNGEGETATKNGLGNLIVGYNENTLDRDPVCSDGKFETQEECEGNNQVFNVVHRDGSHNIVVGRDHHYSQYGGLVAGLNNKITGPYATVTGGLRNLARGEQSSVTGGTLNKATGISSSVTGGLTNVASAPQSSVTGGIANTAFGPGSSVTGGAENIAEGDVSSITGGQGNTVPTNAHYSSISGGANNDVVGQHSWRVSNELATADEP